VGIVSGSRYRGASGLIADRSHANCGTSTGRGCGAKCDVCSARKRPFTIDSIYAYIPNQISISEITPFGPLCKIPKSPLKQSFLVWQGIYVIFITLHKTNDMTSIEKAKELVDKFYQTTPNEAWYNSPLGSLSMEYKAWEQAKQCALIAVDEIYNALKNTLAPAHGVKSGQNYQYDNQYWESVKHEIEQL